MTINRFIKVLTLYLILSLSSSMFAQESLIINKFSVKLSGSVLNSATIRGTELSPLIFIEADYTINKFVDIGIYGGFALVMHSYELPYNSTTGMYQWYSADSTSYMISNSAEFSSTSKAYFYGINSNIHLLPFIFPKDIRIDVYLCPKIGIMSEHLYEYNATQELVWSNPLVEYSLGMGVKYNFTKRLGIYTEYSLGKFYNNNKSRVIAGIVFKF